MGLAFLEIPSSPSSPQPEASARPSSSRQQEQPAPPREITPGLSQEQGQPPLRHDPAWLSTVDASNPPWLEHVARPVPQPVPLPPQAPRLRFSRPAISTAHFEAALRGRGRTSRQPDQSSRPSHRRRVTSLQTLNQTFLQVLPEIAQLEMPMPLFHEEPEWEVTLFDPQRTRTENTIVDEDAELPLSHESLEDEPLWNNSESPLQDWDFIAAHEAMNSEWVQTRPPLPLRRLTAPFLPPWLLVATNASSIYSRRRPSVERQTPVVGSSRSPYGGVENIRPSLDDNHNSSPARDAGNHRDDHYGFNYNFHN